MSGPVGWEPQGRTREQDPWGGTREYAGNEEIKQINPWNMHKIKNWVIKVQLFIERLLAHRRKVSDLYLL